ARHRPQPHHLGDRRRLGRVRAAAAGPERRRLRPRRRRPAAPRRPGGQRRRWAVRLRPRRSVLSFVAYPDPRLNKAAEPRGFVDEALRAVGERLLAAAKEAKAYGLAAVHIGEVEPVVVISGDPEGREYLLLFNPVVTAVATETEPGEEGSVSLPGIR